MMRLFCFRAIITLKRSKSFMPARAALDCNVLHQDEASHFVITFSVVKAFVKVFTRACRGILMAISVNDKRFNGIIYRLTPVKENGPSIKTLFSSTTSMIVHNLPLSGPYDTKATRPTSTNLLKGYHKKSYIPIPIFIHLHLDKEGSYHVQLQINLRINCGQTIGPEEWPLLAFLPYRWFVEKITVVYFI